MKIAFNPLGSGALTKAPDNKDITFDLVGRVIYARGVPFDGKNTQYKTFKKHTSSDNTGGSEGLVPIPSYSTTNTRLLREDGQWVNIAGAAPPDTELSTESTNTVQNKVITNKINEILASMQLKAADVYKNIKVGTTTLVASGVNDTLEFKLGNGITITPNATNKTLEFSINATGNQGISTSYSNKQLIVKIQDEYYNKWNAVYDWYISVTEEDTDDLINKWQEIVDFLNSVAEGTDILDEFVTRKTAQTITGVKTFNTQQKFTVADGTSPFTVTSKTLVTNLNADLLDGYHRSDIIKYYGATETSGFDLNNLRSGTAIVVGYWAYAGSANVSNQPWGSSAATTWTLPGSYPMQIARFYNSNDIKVRGYYSSSGWTSWVTLLHSGNYKTQIGDGVYWKVNGQTTVGTGDIYLEMWRGANASWKMLNTSGTLKFQCNYTSAVGSYYDALTVTYNTGNVWTKGSITSATGIHNSSTTLYLDSASTTTSIIFRHGTTERMRIAQPNGYVGIGTTAPIHKLQVTGAGVFSNTGSTTYASDGITIGAGDAVARYITCYGKTGLSYINIGYNAAANNSGELHFSYSSSGSTSNYVGLQLYGAANCVRIYPGYTQSIKYIQAPNYVSSVATGTQPYACTSTTLNTNLNADLLDGYHASSFELIKVGTAKPTGTAVGWYRCAQISSSNAGYSQNIIISLQRSYNSPQNEHYIFAISVGYNGQVSINQISGCIGGQRINKVRVVYNNSGKCYFDYYMQTSNYNNSYKVQILAGDCISYQNPVLVSSAGGTAVEFTTVNGIKSNYGFTGNLIGNASSASKLGSSTVGGTYQPIYLSSGTATAGTSYAKAIKAITRSGTTFTYTCIDGTTGTFTQQDNNTDTKVTNTLSTTTKFYVTGTSSATTNTGTQYFDTGVYVGTTAGQLYATYHASPTTLYLDSASSTSILFRIGGTEVARFAQPTGHLTLAAQRQILRAGNSASWYQGRSHALLYQNSYTGYNPCVAMKTTNGVWALGVYSSDTVYMTYVTDTNYNAGTNTATYQITFPKASGTLALTSQIPAVPVVTNYYWANVKVSATSSTSTYPTFANMKSTGRIYAGEWIEFSGNTGLYWPNSYGAHFYPNNTSTYGQFKLLGTKGDYSGILFGSSTSFLTVMSTATHHGLYHEGGGIWEFYYNSSSKGVGIRTSTITKNISMSGQAYISSNTWIGTTSGGEMLNVGGWVATIGNTGWYNATHTGGIYMSDSTWVRVYNGKSFYVPGNAQIDGTLYLYKTTDAAANADNRPALIVGGGPTSTHIEMDCNEIIAKSNGTAITTLYLNSGGAASTVRITKSTVGGTDKPVYLYQGAITQCNIGGWESGTAVYCYGVGGAFYLYCRRFRLGSYYLINIYGDCPGFCYSDMDAGAAFYTSSSKSTKSQLPSGYRPTSGVCYAPWADASGNENNRGFSLNIDSSGYIYYQGHSDMPTAMGGTTVHINHVFIGG